MAFHTFPYSLGGAMIAGLMSILSSCCVMCVYCEGLDKNSIKNWICWMSIVTSFVIIALILGVGFSGIWGISKAQGDINLGRETNWSYQEIEQAETNRDYAVATLVLILSLCVLHIIAWCQCCKFLSTFGFNDNSCRYEYRHYERSRRQPLPRDQHATRENRSAEVSFSIPVPEIYYGTTQHPTAVNSVSSNGPSVNPDLEQGLSFNNPSVTTGSTAEVSFSIPVPEIYYGTTQYPTTFNQASESSNVPTVNPDLEQGISFNNPSVTAGCTDRPPPAYEDIEKGGLPSYDEVVNEGHY